jgi:integrase
MLPCDYKPVFNSLFKKELQSFLSNKRSLGCKYETQAHILYRLDKYIWVNGITDFGDSAMVDWAKKGDTESAGAHYIRISLYRQFIMYLNRHDICVPLPLRTKNSLSKSFVPYIFTRTEIEHLLQVADQLPKKRNSSADRVMPVLFRLLYCCGLRISEATALRIKDVDFNRSLLTIAHGKNDVCRTIPMTKSLSAVILDYLNEVYVSVLRPEFFVFPTSKMEQHGHASVYRWFREILWQSGISHYGRGKGPRLHDLRHTFAVHSLQTQINEGRDANLLLPILSRYLGHRNIYQTEKYLHLTAEMYPDILEKVEAYFGIISPEVIDNEAN